MSRQDPFAPDEDDALLAAEFALGVLGGAEMRRAERRRARDAAFAGEVAAWDARLSPLLAAIEPAEPPRAVWQGIERDLSRMTRTAPSTRKAAAPAGAVAGFWRWLALGSSGLLAASLAALALLVGTPSPAPVPMTASILGEGSVPLYTAVVYPGAAGATLVPVSVSDAPGHSHELWLIAPGGTPQSLGVLKAQGPLRIEIAPELLANGGVLAISLEPLGGSPTGQPTGPVVGKGELHRI